MVLKQILVVFLGVYAGISVSAKLLKPVFTIFYPFAVFRDVFLIFVWFTSCFLSFRQSVCHLFCSTLYRKCKFTAIKCSEQDLQGLSEHLLQWYTMLYTWSESQRIAKILHPNPATSSPLLTLTLRLALSLILTLSIECYFKLSGGELLQWVQKACK